MHPPVHRHVVDGAPARLAALPHRDTTGSTGDTSGPVSVITSGGNRNPANADRPAFGERLEVDSSGQLPGPGSTATAGSGRVQQTPLPRPTSPASMTPGSSPLGTGTWSFCLASTGSTEAVDRAPLEHRGRPASASGPMIIATSGLHAAPVSATEHRSSTDQSTRDSQPILSAANVQVRGLL